MQYYTPIAFLIVLCAFHSCIAQVKIDCQRPPQLVDPAQCCKDGGPDEVTENCAKRMGISEQNKNAPPSIETATCLAECILTESRYLQKPDVLQFDSIRSDLMSKYANDSAYATTMLESYQKCHPNTQRKMQAFKQTPFASAGAKRGCSPFSGMLLGCTYMEYFKNCPSHRWTNNAECALAKQFVTQCSLGA